MRRGAAPNPEGRWEFIGGKIEPGETPEEALVRECREELALEIEEVRIIDSVVHEYPEKTIRLTLLECRHLALTQTKVSSRTVKLCNVPLLFRELPENPSKNGLFRFSEQYSRFAI